jgi:hypothetical protein
MTDPTTPRTDPIKQARGTNGKWVRTLEGAERDAEAARLRSKGKSYRQIAAALGCDVHVAHSAVKRVIAEIITEPAEAAIAFELERLDRLHRAAMKVLERHHVTVSNGKVVEVDGQPLLDDGPVLSAIDRLVRISESRRKLLGLDQPAKMNVSGGLTYEVVGIDPEALR